MITKNKKVLLEILGIIFAGIFLITCLLSGYYLHDNIVQCINSVILNISGRNRIQDILPQNYKELFEGICFVFTIASFIIGSITESIICKIRDIENNNVWFIFGIFFLIVMFVIIGFILSIPLNIAIQTIMLCIVLYIIMYYMFCGDRLM